MWKKLLKRIAGVAFMWGLKTLTKLAPEEIKSVDPGRKPRSRKHYQH